MSLYNKASLIQVPSLYKDGTLVSTIPEDRSGDFTVARGSNLAATRVGEDGYIKKGYENLLFQSNNFDTTWLTSGILVPNQIGYDGSSDAWLFESPSTFMNIGQSVSQSGVQVFSAYAKAGTTDWVQLRLLGSSTIYATFDLNPSTTGSRIGAKTLEIDAFIEDVGNGWFRCSLVANNATSTARIYIARNNSTTINVGDNIYIQDAQLEIGLAATDYIETGATTGKAGLLEDEPRFDYSGGATCPSLLLEPSRTNLVQSEYFGVYTNSNSTDEANATTSPEGLANATSFLEAATTGQHKLVTSLSLDGSSTYTLSIFAKHNGRDLYIDTGNSNEWGGRAWFDLTAGTANAVLGTADIEDFGNGWYRCIVTGASTLAGGNQIELLTSDGVNNSTTGDITKGVYIYGAQLEQGSYPTSYIPNHSGGSVTRGADDATLLNIDTNIVDITGDFTFFVDNTGSLMKGTELYYYFIELYWNSSTSVRYYSTSNGSWYYKPDNDYTGYTNAVGKQVIKYDNGVFYHFLNGNKSTDTRTMATSDSLSQINLRTNTQGKAGYLDIKQALLFDTALSDADCITLTT